MKFPGKSSFDRVRIRNQNFCNVQVIVYYYYSNRKISKNQNPFYFYATKRSNAAHRGFQAMTGVNHKKIAMTRLLVGVGRPFRKGALCILLRLFPKMSELYLLIFTLFFHPHNVNFEIGPRRVKLTKGWDVDRVE